MPVVLTTTLKWDGKVVEEGTPFSKLTKAQKEMAKELNLLENVPDELEEEEEADEAEEASTEDSEESEE